MEENKTERLIAVCKGVNMKYEVLCKEIIKYVGGKDNINSVTHCITRLRFKLKDESKANKESLKNLEGVMDVIQAGGQYQVVIGTHVEAVYKELIQIGDFKKEAPVPADEEKTGGVLSRFLALISEIFQPVLSMLMASGMIKALLVLLVVLGVLTKADHTYIILSGVGDALFYFFPIALGWSSAKKFGIKEIYGITLGGVLVYPTISALTSGEVLYTIFAGTIFESPVYATFLGIPVLLRSYSTTVIPIILIVYVASIIYKWLNKVLPAVLRSFFVPFITLIVVAPLGLIVIGPIAMVLQNGLGQMVIGLVGLNPGIAGLVLGSIWSVLVMFGLHWGIIPMFAINVAQYGYDVINPLIFSGALASMGAVLGIIIRTKKVSERNIAIPALISTFFGVNEPTLYGILVPRKKLMIATFLSAGVGSAIAGFSGAKLWAFGTSGPLGLPCFINPAGIDMGFIGLCIGAVVSFVLALTAALILGDKKDEEKVKVK